MKQILVVLYEANAIFGLQFVCTQISLMPAYYVASLILRACLFTPMDYIIWIIFGGVVMFVYPDYLSC
jgi:hypothetical protein